MVGPFNSVDMRTGLSQGVFDFSNTCRYQPSRAAFRADADVEACQANGALAEAALKQAENQKNAGTGTGIEVTRAKVQLANENQHPQAVWNERNNAHLQLLRATGLNLATELEIAGKLSYEPVDAISLEQADANAVKFERLPSLVAYAD